MAVEGEHVQVAETDVTGPIFKIGDHFKSFEELEKRIKEFEDFYFVKFWKREARTVEAAQKRVNHLST